MSYINLSGASSSGASRPSHWTVLNRLRALTSVLSEGSSLDLRFKERYYYKKNIATGGDGLYPGIEMMATHSRASSAWYPNWDFRSGSAVGRLQEYSADQRRYGTYGALDEGAGTNHIRNPRCEGAVAGTPGTAPTNFQIAAAGTTSEIVGSGTENGWPYFDVRLNGTPTGDPGIFFEPVSQVAATNAETWSFSCGFKVAGGGTTNINGVILNTVEANSGGGLVRNNRGAVATIDNTARRFFQTVTLSGGGTTVSIRPKIEIDWDGSGAVDVTLRIYAPQLEQASEPSSPILPAVDAPAVSTRAADSVTGVTTDRASRGWYADQWDFTNGGICGGLTEFLPDVPRIGPQGLLVEEGTTNEIRNPRGEGAVSGTPGTLPTNWSSSLGSAVQEVVGAGTEDGWPYLELSLTFSAAGNPQLYFDSATQISAATGETWAFSCGVRVVSDSSGVLDSILMRQRESTAGGANVQNNDTAGVGADSTRRRFKHTVTLSGGGTVAAVRAGLVFVSSGAGTIVVRIYAPQIEKKAYPTSPVLPEPGVIAASTRAADDMTLSNGEWTSDTGFSVYGEFVLNTVAQDGSPFSIASGGSDRTDVLACEGGDLKFRYRSNGVTDASAIIRSAQVAEVVRAAIGVDQTGVTASVSGAATSNYTPTAVLQSASLSFGKGWPSASTAGSFFVASVRYYPTRLSNSELEAQVA